MQWMSLVRRHRESLAIEIMGAGGISPLMCTNLPFCMHAYGQLLLPYNINVGGCTHGFVSLHVATKAFVPLKDAGSQYMAIYAIYTCFTKLGFHILCSHVFESCIVLCLVSRRKSGLVTQCI